MKMSPQVQQFSIIFVCLSGFKLFYCFMCKILIARVHVCAFIYYMCVCVWKNLLPSYNLQNLFYVLVIVHM